MLRALCLWRGALVVALCLLWSASASALVPQQTTWVWNYSTYSGASPDPQAMCVQYGGAYAALREKPASKYTNITSTIAGSENHCNADGVDEGFNLYMGSGYSALQCPANSTPSGSECACSAGFQEDAGFCIPQGSELDEFCQQGFNYKNTQKMTGTISASAPTPSASCWKPDPPFEGPDAVRGCSMSIGDIVRLPVDDDPSKHWWSATGKYTGTSCDDSAANDENPKSEDDKCPGGFAGTVNGVERCIPAEPDKGIEGVRSGSTTDSNGTRHDTTETTKCEGRVCTTTTNTTSTTSGGSVSNTTTSVTQSLDEKCAKDPSNPICKKTNDGKGPTAEVGCSSNASAEGCGGAGAPIGDLYMAKDETIQSVLEGASATLAASPLGTATSGFFTVSGGGSCPSSSWSIPYVNATVSMTALCDGTAQTLLLALKGVVLLCAAFFAFRVAIE